MTNQSSMARCRYTLAIEASVVVMMALMQGAMAMRFTVGGLVGWSEQGLEFGRDPNFFQNWALRNNPFHTIDELEFRWSSGDSVLQVDFVAFKACTTLGAIKAWFSNPGGEQMSMVFPLSDYKFYTLYFISGDGDHCRAGQKFFIDVFE